MQASGSSAAVEKEKAVDLDGVPSFVDDLEKEVRRYDLSFTLPADSLTFGGLSSSL